MTKTVDTVTRPTSVKESAKSREASQSPPLVLKYLEALPPERELTLLVEVVEKPLETEFKVPKIIAEHPAKHYSIASVVKHEIKEETPEEFEDEIEAEIEDEEEEDCLRIIEEKIIDVSTLPGRPLHNEFLIFSKLNELLLRSYFFVRLVALDFLVLPLVPSAFYYAQKVTRKSVETTKN